MVLLAFAESKTVSTTTLGLVFPTVWDQSSHRFGFLYILLDEFCPKHNCHNNGTWLGFLLFCVSTVTCFSLDVCDIHDIRQDWWTSWGRRLTTCPESLFFTSSTLLWWLVSHLTCQFCTVVFFQDPTPTRPFVRVCYDNSRNDWLCLENKRCSLLRNLPLCGISELFAEWQFLLIPSFDELHGDSFE